MMKQLKSITTIPLPLSDLLALIKSDNLSPFTAHFSVIFIEMGFERLNPTVS
jgi:hypothetical protein